MSDFFRTNTRYDNQQRTNILKTLELVITENYVTWDSNIYKQTKGVAMGTPVAVAYANIFMSWVDREIRLKAPYIFEHIRYIDDNLFILPNSKIEDLIRITNNILPPHIKFTYERLDSNAQVGLPFLYTQLFISTEGSIQSRLYTKKTDRHAYLLPASFHPPHITQNIPIAVFSRIRKICSTEEWFMVDAEKAVDWLTNRGYNKLEVKRALDKVKTKDRWEMIMNIEGNRDRTEKEAEGDRIRILLVMTYTQHAKEIKKVLRKRQNLLDYSFKKTKVTPRLAHRRQNNLNDTLIQRSLRGPIDKIDKDLNVFTRCEETVTYRSRCPCKGTHRQNICRCCEHSTAHLGEL